MNTQAVEKMVADLTKTERADEMDFVMKRENVEPGKTFSEEALTEFQASIATYINSRLIYHWEKEGLEGPGPGNIKVEVKVTVDDKNYPPLDHERPWFVIDGSSRNAGL